MKLIVDHYITLPGSVCSNCSYRKEKYPHGPHEECLSCGYLKERNDPYEKKIPVYAEDSLHRSDRV